MKKKALILLTLCMVSLTACGTKESVKPVPATEQTAKAEPTEEVQEVIETQKQEVKKPETSNTRVLKGFRSRAVETANDDGTFDYKFYCQGKVPKTHEEYTIAYEIDNVPMRLEQTNFMGEYDSTGNVKEGGWLTIQSEDIRYGQLGHEEELSNLDTLKMSDLDDGEKFVKSSYKTEKSDDYTKVFYDWAEAGNIYSFAVIRDNKTGQTYQIQYSLYQDWGNDKHAEIQNFRDTVKLIPFDESLFEE